MSTDPLFLAQSITAFLESPYKPFLMYLPFIPWAWLISSRLDKDSGLLHLNQFRWNALNLGTGIVALVLMLWIPIFWVGWPLAIIMLLAPILVYWRYRNAQVPEVQQFHLTSSTFTDMLQARRQSKATREATIHFQDAAGTGMDVPVKDDPAFEIHLATEDLIGPAIEGRAIQLEITVSGEGTQVTQVVDGIRYSREALTKETGMKVIEFLKDLAQLDLDNLRRRQSGGFSLNGPSGQTKVHVTTAGSTSGLVLRMEFNRENRLSRPWDNLGLLPPQSAILDDVDGLENAHGIILFAAPVGQGLSTMGYSLLNRHDAYTLNIRTLENEIEFYIDGVSHKEFDSSDQHGYTGQLQTILRRDPDILLTRPLLVKDNDRETAILTAASGRDGPLIYVPQRARSLSDQLQQWMQLVGDEKKAANALRIVLQMRLVRSLCKNCRQPYIPTAEQLRSMHVPEGKVEQLYRAGGKVQVKNKIEPCEICMGTGFLGQLGIYEVMKVDRDIRKLIISMDMKSVMAQARRNKMIYLQEAAMTRVVAGDTSIEEVLRVTSPKRSRKSSRKPQEAEPT